MEDTELIRDAWIVLSNEREFYVDVLMPLKNGAMKAHAKGIYSRQKLAHAIDNRLMKYLREERRSGYWNVKIPKESRFVLVQDFVDYLEEGWILGPENSSI